jgi:hypothetical protein
MKRVDIKIRPMYRDILKKYCKENGLKMYVFVEKLIENNCSNLPKKKLLKSEVFK